MKQNILPALRLTLVTIIFFCGIYTLVIWGVAQAAPGKGEGVTVAANGKVVGYELEGQNFTQDKYFYSRPSAAGYNAASASGSNYGPSNPDYLKTVGARVDTFLAHNPGVTRDQIPSELVTASGSGLDPDISPEAAKIQVKRVAAARGVSEQKISALVDENTQSPLLGLFGTARVNVLRLNLALDALK